MKVKLYQYQDDFAKTFEKEKARIYKKIDGIEIFHIGSTAIKGMIGKGIIDLMVVPQNWEERLDIVMKLRKIGYNHVHSEEEGRIFVSTKVKTEKGDFHIHIVKKESNNYMQLLFLVKFLNENKWAREKYEEIKLAAIDMDRDKYGRAKGEFVKRILKERDFLLDLE